MSFNFSIGSDKQTCMMNNLTVRMEAKVVAQLFQIVLELIKVKIDSIDLRCTYVYVWKVSKMCILHWWTLAVNLGQSFYAR